MAAIAAIFGGVLGFFAALVGVLAFELSGLQALSLWSATGLEATLILMSIGSIQGTSAQKRDANSRAHA